MTNVTINANGTGAFGSGGVALITGTAILTNTIVAGDRQAAGAMVSTTDISGSVISGGHNLILVDPRPAGYMGGTGDIFGQDPQLLPLANNGGPTLTEALGPGSLARGNGDPAACAAPPVSGVDQRGMPRNPAYCSIGAYDDGGMALPPGTETAIVQTQTAVAGTQTAIASQTAGARATATSTPTNTATGTATTAPANTATTTATNTSVSATTTPPASATSTSTAAPSTTATTSPSTTNTPAPPTNMSTSTPTNMSTSTPTNTSTSMPTNTSTNTATNTSTSAPTSTSTNTSTNTPINTGTAVPPRSTATPTFTPVPTIVPVTPAPAPTDTATATATGEPLPPIVTRSYLAGGIDTPDQPSFVSIVHPSAARARVRLTFYFPNGATHGAVFTVARDTQRTIPVSSLIGRTGSFGLAVASDRGIVAGLVLARNGRDDDTLVGSSTLARTWYLAEGYTALTFHQTVALLNPDPDHAARVSLLLLPAGGRGRRETVTVSARAR